ncbi:phage tail assembly chaperone [Sphingosinicella sp. YJ22]|uniref:phage tail assembly chaperone n=1 Tax=Sphingosinicella sp. YJ22 TaxID=1104780 RepID=UPI00140C0167|nr:phage tail assembly chaperone [Sphingosinicella sp. YJ22]
MFSEAAARLAGLTGSVLGWPAEQFWRATPAELACVLQAFSGGGSGALVASDLARLKEMYPDG